MTWSANLMVEVYGRTPGASCRSCIHLRATTATARKFNCDLREGRGLEHRPEWPACGKHERKGGAS